MPYCMGGVDSSVTVVSYLFSISTDEDSFVCLCRQNMDEHINSIGIPGLKIIYRILITKER